MTVNQRILLNARGKDGHVQQQTSVRNPSERQGCARNPSHAVEKRLLVKRKTHFRIVLRASVISTTRNWTTAVMDLGSVVGVNLKYITQRILLNVCDMDMNGNVKTTTLGVIANLI
jgi:hypothetical protein